MNRAVYHKAWREANKERLREQRRRKREARSVEQIEKDRAYQRAWKEAHPSKSAEYSRTQKSRHGDRLKKQARVQHRKRLYGLSDEAYKALLERQNNCCALCGYPLGKNPCVDHCHITGKVRGLLHHKCNSGLGMFDDSLKKVAAAFEYLVKHAP